MTPVNVFFIDNYDSFSFNLVDDVRQRGGAIEVWRNDIDADWALQRALALPPPRMILMSPGPGRPEDAGCCEALVKHAAGRVPVFGVCLGLQAMVQALGGRVAAAGAVVHGKSALVEHEGTEIFAGLPSPLSVGRYHSLVAIEVPDALRVTARCGSLVMAVAHREHALAAVQFHPESILTPLGGQLLEGVMRWAAQHNSEDAARPPDMRSRDA